MNRLAVRAALLAIGAICALPAHGQAQPATGPAATSEPASKKQRLLEDKARAEPARDAERARWRKELRRRVGQKPAALINIYNTWTHEFVAVEATGDIGTPPAQMVNRFLRCHFTNHPTTMDAALFGVLVRAARHFKAPRVDIVSGFRAPKYNLILRKKGRRVARKSEHTFGNAVDFRLPGITTERLRTWARRQKLGGVGYYRDDRFIHVDTGPVRYWAE
ncbi:MAG TPA: DUF882 domain-containing protein [Kofleriaceae bacterium]|nr:DUF882 domain-containing protein [Kofleriaceae bacterium]